MFSPWEAIGKTVRYQIQVQAVLEQCLCPRQHKRKALGSANGKARHFLRVTAEA